MVCFLTAVAHLYFPLTDNEEDNMCRIQIFSNQLIM